MGCAGGGIFCAAGGALDFAGDFLGGGGGAVGGTNLSRSAKAAHSPGAADWDCAVCVFLALCGGPVCYSGDRASLRGDSDCAGRESGAGCGGDCAGGDFDRDEFFGGASVGYF